MNRLLTTTLSTLSLIAIVNPSLAVDLNGSTTRVEGFNNKLVAMKNVSTNINSISAINLVQISYQGFLENEGIPSGNTFISSVNQGKINAKTLVKSAIAKGRLSTQTLSDQGYLNVVQNELDNLTVK